MALVVTASAAAHADVSPRVLEAGRATTLRVELPQLRPGGPPSALAVSGAGVRQLSVEPTGLAGVESRWRARVRVDTAPGPLTLVLRAQFADGASVEVRQAVTVVPARARAGPAVPGGLLAGLAAAAVAIAAAAAFVLRRSRHSG